MRGVGRYKLLFLEIIGFILHCTNTEDIYIDIYDTQRVLTPANKKLLTLWLLLENCNTLRLLTMNVNQLMLTSFQMIHKETQSVYTKS